MKSNRVLFTIALVLFTSMTMAQGVSDSSIVLSIGSEKVTKGEFINMYGRNNPNPKGSINQKDLDEYLELFINYKLKVHQAVDLGLDTTEAYLKEIASYRSKLADPYWNDKQVTEDLVKEAYDREKEILRASHILISLPTNWTPQDTIEAYNKALKIRERIIKGEDFATLAAQYSADPSVKDIQRKDQPTIKGNNGDLGYFTSFNMIYPFESACYNMKVGEVSFPVRSPRGYHIIKLTDRKPAPFSTAVLAHIWVNLDSHASEQECQEIINKAYSELKAGKRFDSVANEYSDDKYSLRQGGMLKDQKVVNIPVEYIDHIASTPLYTISEPFRTRYGWHIIEPIALNPIPSLDAERDNIVKRISRDQRGYKTKEAFIDKTKKEYNFTENTDRVKAITKIVTDSIFSAKWKVPETFVGSAVLFTIGLKSYSQKDLALYIEKMQHAQTPQYIPNYVNDMYQRMVDEKVFAYGDIQLENKYPELRSQVNEFREGILIFDVTDKMVWTRSLVDSIGVQQYYNDNQDNYKWDKRADAAIFTFYNDKLDMKKAKKVITKGFEKAKANEDIIGMLADKFSIKKDTASNFDFRWGKFEKGENKIVDSTLIANGWNYGINGPYINGKTKNIVVIYNTIAPTNKTLDEAKGIVTSDYQGYLEKQWIKELRSKYTYSVDKDVYKSIK